MKLVKRIILCLSMLISLFVGLSVTWYYNTGRHHNSWQARTWIKQAHPASMAWYLTEQYHSRFKTFPASIDDLRRMESDLDLQVDMSDPRLDQLVFFRQSDTATYPLLIGLFIPKGNFLEPPDEDMLAVSAGDVIVDRQRKLIVGDRFYIPAARKTFGDAFVDACITKERKR